jgi:ATP/maltotriose-dependent transcriptional regulator MalT
MEQTSVLALLRSAQPGAFDPTSNRLLDALGQRADELAEVVAVATRANLNAPYDEPAAHTIEHVREHVRLLVQMARTGQSPTAEQLDFARREFVRKVGTVPFSALLHGYRVGYHAMCGWIAEEARAHAHDVQDVVSLTGRTFDYLDLVRSSVAEACLSEWERPGVPLVVLVARGLTNKEIAVHLQISLQTTKEYMSRVLEKTGLPSRAAVAASYALTSAIAIAV